MGQRLKHRQFSFAFPDEHHCYKEDMAERVKSRALTQNIRSEFCQLRFKTAAKFKIGYYFFPFLLFVKVGYYLSYV